MSESTQVEVMKQHLIDPEICIRCNSCEEACPIDAITHDANNYVVKPDVCMACQACLPVCPTGAIDNWIRVLAKETYPIEEQFEWMSLPAEQALPDDAVEIPTGGRREGAQDESPSADGQAALSAGSAPGQGDELIEGQPATTAGSSVPPWSAAHPYVNLYTHKHVAEATVAGNYRISAEDAESDIHHIVLDFESLPFPVLEGQSIAVFPPGQDANGRPYYARQYSIASPRDGERPGYNNLSLTVKRVTADYDGNPATGVCSNYLCDLRRGDKVRVIGPLGDTFLMPNLDRANLLMICTGTGAAPMRAMTERCRRLTRRGEFHGRLMLFFGARTQRELPYFGPLMGLPKGFIDINLALSREPGQPKRHVQDLIVERSSDVLTLLQDPNTHIYVCGLKGMEHGTLAAMKDIVEVGGQSWQDLSAGLREQGRMHFETY
ncbi:benzoyl-CoA 2,3-epoxidase subunit BoxA [Castellaniella sp.]|uniref:benzoyl-CoA 2,3-epoxidase subunit BoxA n=1 Tax=Castellaniella sp. TaxID=1955812 RepID=UPI002AFDFE45|nr:benzoyl-CoA 2,3-epoxidase subunit BoxA [Castellaniella sp.]